MRIEQFSENDIERLVSHSQSVGWYQPSDWECFLRTGTVIGHVESSSVVSSVYVSNHHEVLGWVGAFIVHPDHQGRGLGKELMARCIDLCPRNERFRLGLVSTEEGLPLYERTGFSTVGSTDKLVTDADFRMPQIAAPPGWSVRKLRSIDMDAVVALDARAFGVERVEVLNVRARNAVQNLVALDQDGTVQGLILGALDSERLVLGPVIAPSTAVALALVSMLSTYWSGPMRIDIPSERGDFADALQRLGFRLERRCPLMSYRGRPLEYAATYFALIAQALG